MTVNNLDIDPNKEMKPGPGGTNRMLNRLRDLNATLGVERSFKLYRGGISTARVLVGIDCEGLDPGHLQGLLDEIGMPAGFRRDFLDRLSEANKVGFGFEEGPQVSVYKVYLEFWDRLVEDLRASRDKYSPRLLFLGFKWGTSDKPSQAVDRYDCYPMLPVSAIINRIDDLYDGNTESPPRDIVRKLIGLAARPLVGDSFVYTEVSDATARRRSFDVNLYKSELLLGQIEPLLAQMGEYFGIERQVLEAATVANRRCRLGHLSGGRDRRSGDFLTIYYEVEDL